jgi:hypothetical protein
VVEGDGLSCVSAGRQVMLAATVTI